MDAKAQSWLAAVESQESSMAQQKKSAAKDIGKERPRIGGIGVEKPMPAEVRPMVAQSSAQPFDDPDWIFEMK
jgi:bifunctional non-homologous end joining protein LigD